jgi:hypothetical protein
VQDVLACLQSATGLKENKQVSYAEKGVTPTQNEIDLVASLLTPVKVSLADLTTDSGLPWRTLAAIVVELELGGRAIIQSGGLVSGLVIRSITLFLTTRLGRCCPQASRHAFQVVILAQLFQFEDEIADQISHLKAISGNFGRSWRLGDRHGSPYNNLCIIKISLAVSRESHTPRCITLSFAESH